MIVDSAMKMIPAIFHGHVGFPEGRILGLGAADLSWKDILMFFFVMAGCNLIYSKLDGSGPIFWIYIWLTIPFFLEHVGYFHFSSSFGDLPTRVRNQYPSALPILCSAVKSPDSKTENPQFLRL